MRRYWQPAALAEELPPGGAPLPVRLLGEDLVLFRDSEGRPGLLATHCSHRGADLSYGRLEDGGLRCIYHGWLYDIHGRCLEQPGEPAGSRFHERIQHPAYPCQARAGVIFAYLGPGEPPLLPNYEFLTVPDDQVFAIKLLSECNYLQGVDGAIDPGHLAFLHRVLSSPDEADVRATVEPELTEFGVRIYCVRKIGTARNYVRLGYFILPNAAAFAASIPTGYSVNWHVPIDDVNYWKYTFVFDREKPLNMEQIRRSRTAMTPDYHPIPNRANRYMQDRALMKTESYCGIPTRYFQSQDLCVQEGPGRIQDRTEEHLAYTDRSIVATRLLLSDAVKAVQQGREPPHVIRDAAANRFDDLVVRDDTLPASVDWRTYWKTTLP
jgi:phenylpropionate dioxygenase-like ring-hydroxylating dioxygenase large terminal subunit